ncbi:pyruvate kinase [Acuticoccus kandeliae]|uniref:pyruvate kinase n=1 Tax=Acuticoccus kandeliae TaxID=2073160 RepID=UPI000D3E3B88|nr:pyruvate kinase [Acuticoccus kandeliae]
MSEFQEVSAPEDRALLADILTLRRAVADAAPAIAAELGTGVHSPALDNLTHYLALRRHDVRDLQHSLMWRGLSSLGRLESRVLPTLDAVAAALSRMVGDFHPAPSEADYFAGDRRLAEASETLFGPATAARRARIMVTLPTEAATDPSLVDDLVRRGMNVARINCAHDDRAAWKAMAEHIGMAARQHGRPVKILMDIAGPKIRTTETAHAKKQRKAMPGDALRLFAAGAPAIGEDAPFAATISFPEVVERVHVGDRVVYDDGKLHGVVEEVSPGSALVRVRRARAAGTRIKPEKGLNFPDTAVGLSPLTTKDEADLATVIECADSIGYSFVSHPDDLDLLEAAIARSGATGRPLGLVAKIERPEAVRNLPNLIARAAGRRPFGIMIARGDLAAEIGFERLAEMQEEIMWVCEAASVPVIWATQVLETLVKEGTPTRGEMTDAAMSARAECVMLNKGPFVGDAVEILDRLLTRMESHILKKTPTLRALKSW